MNAVTLAAQIAQFEQQVALALEKIAYYSRMADSAMKARELAYWGKKLADAQRALTALRTGTAVGHIIPRVFGGVGRVVTFGATNGTAATAAGVGTLVVIGGILIWIAAGVAGKMAADKPIEAVARQPQGQPPGALQEPVTGETLPTGGSNAGGGLGATGPVPTTVDRDSFTGVWVQGSGTTAVSRAVLVQTGADVKGRVEIPEGIYGDGGKILIPRGTYDLTGTVEERKLTFTLDKFSGDVSLNPTGNRGMFLSGFMNAPGGRFLGSPFALQRQVAVAKK